MRLRSKIGKFVDYGYEITIIYVYLDNPQACIERILERVMKGGHFVADEEVKRRFFRSKDKFWNIYKNLADRWYLFYNADEKSRFQEVVIGDRSSLRGYTQSLF